jgi:hypothetical protein
MALADLFRTTTTEENPLSGGVAPTGTSILGNTTTQVSDFLSVQSLTNFAAMTGAITAAWNALKRLDASLGDIWVPYAFAGAFGIVSLAISAKALNKSKNKGGDWIAAIFIAVVNALVLASAVVGTEAVTE